MTGILLVLRMLGSLGVVIGLIFVARRFLGGGGLGLPGLPGLGGLGGHGKERTVPIKLVARQSLTKVASIALIESGGRSLLLGVTEHGVTVLTDQPLDSKEPEGEAVGMDVDAPQLQQPWTELLTKVKESTVRR